MRIWRRGSPKAGLAGCGLGRVEVHLRAAARLPGRRLLARDKALATIALRLGIAAYPA